MEFNFTSKQKMFTFILMGVGALMMLIGVFTEKDHLYTTVVDDHHLIVEYPHETSIPSEELKSQMISLAEANSYDIEIEDKSSEKELFWNVSVNEKHEDHGLVAHAPAHGHGHSMAEDYAHKMHCEVSMPDTHHKRFWSNLLVNSFFFFGISLGALFFIGLQYATESGWAVTMKRVKEAVMSYLPVGAITLLIVFIAGSLHWHNIYHWMVEGVSTPGHEKYDSIIAGKSAYLNQPFFYVRALVYLATFILFARFFRKQSLLEDQVGGTDIHFKNYRRGALFLVFFAVFSSTLAWDWIMSIDTHWFSTLFGWYTFSGIWVSATIFILMLIIYLKSRGYLDFVNDSHIHDMGKWMFAISFLWSYLFFSQFLLIWYSDIPEEVTYFMARFEHYPTIYWGMFIVNFIAPMIFLMSREAKKNPIFLITVGSLIFIGHWVDAFIMVMPGTVFSHWQIGFLEIGMFIMFLGLIIFWTFRALTKAPLLVKNHPYLDESLHQHT